MIERQRCTGCGGCKIACSQNAIIMVRDSEGFLYPEIDKGKCIQCGICERICPIESSTARRNMEPQAYYAFARDETVREESSSGGLFSLFAHHVLQQRGVVFGAAMSADCRTVEHVFIESADELCRLRGSKYVQSDTKETYRQVKILLNTGRRVLYSGTPCQIAGLNSALGRHYDGLVTVDVICHGVPSPLAWEKYVEYREKVSASKTRRTFFRHKKYGWKMYSVLFEFSNSTEYEQMLTKDLFMRGFLSNIYLRPSCYQCTYKGDRIQSDITLGDFWGIENVIPELNDDRGVSLAILHTAQGRHLFEDITDDAVYGEVNFEMALKNNPSYFKSVKRPGLRKAAMKDLSRLSFDRLIEKWCGVLLISRIRRKMYVLFGG